MKDFYPLMCKKEFLIKIHEFPRIICFLIFGLLAFGQAAALTLKHRNPYPASNVITNLQSTHENKIVLYRKAGAVTLNLPATGAGNYMMGYYRWFNYLAENTTITLNNEPNKVLTDKGYIFYGNTVADGTSVTFTYAGETTQSIACDVSAYSDYTAGTAEFVEPTLSYRVIFEIHPASELVPNQEETIYAPANKNITVRAQYDKGSYDAKYPTGTYMWSSNTSQQTINASTKYLLTNVTGLAAGQTANVTLSKGTQVLATFHVIFVDNAEPRTDQSINSVTDVNFIRKTSVLNANYDLIASLDFDTQSRIVNKVADTPLDWGESTYGFFYPGLANAKKHTRGDPDWSEYAFVNNTRDLDYFYNLKNSSKSSIDWLGTISDHSSSTGYFMYVDASEEPGVVANLNFNEWLCQGMDLYVVAWIADMNKEDGGKATPNLNFVLMGKKNNTEVEIHKFSTGENSLVHNTNDSKKWYQVFYKINIKSDAYTSYSLRVDNNGTSSIGNDFAIDDIRIYRSKPVMTAFQSDYICGTADSKTNAILRIDYNPLFGQESSHTIWYRVTNDEPNPIIETSVEIFKNPSANGQKVYATWDAYWADTNKPTSFYVKDNVTNTYIYYIILGDLFTPGKTYKAELAASENNLGRNDCGLIAEFAVQQTFVLKDVENNNTEIISGSSLCGSTTYLLKPSMIGVAEDGQPMVIPVSCSYDGVLMKSDVDASYITSLKNALTQFRTVYPTKTTFEGVTATGVFTNDMLNLLIALADEGKLMLYKTQFECFLPSSTTLRLLVKPIDASIVDENNRHINICSDGIVYDLNGGAEESPKLVFGFSDVTYPSLNNHGIRFSENYAAGTSIYTLPVKTFTGSGSVEVSLNSSTDITAPTSYTASYSSNVMTLTISGGQKFKPGYQYNLLFKIRGSLDTRCGASTILPVKIVPTYQTWEPKDKSTSWNNDDNWRPSVLTDWDVSSGTPSGFNTLGSRARGFVPMGTINSYPAFTILSNSTLPSGAANYPSLKAWSISGKAITPATGEACTGGIQYDINFVPNATKQIHFEPASELDQHQLLVYDKAWVELKINADRWWMLSSPFPKTVSGDFHLQRSGVDSRAPFIQLTGIDPTVNRLAPAVYQKAWENSVVNVSRFGPNDTYQFNASNWITPHNYLKEDYAPGTGFAIWADNDANNDQAVVFRFPKEDTRYYYYTEYGAVSTKFEDIDRTNTRGNINKLIDPTNVSNVSVSKTGGSSKVFLLGNPFMSHLNMNTFLSANNSLQSKFWIDTDDGLHAVKINENGEITSTGLQSDLLAPMQAFFVEAKNSGDALSGIQFTAAMMTLDSYTGTTPTNPLRAASSVQNDNGLRIHATREGNKSTLLLMQRQDASDLYDENEDMVVLMDDRLSDRPMIYTITDGQALMIDVRRNLGKVPLGINSDSESAVTLQFDGVEMFDEVSLYDSQTGETTSIASSGTQVKVNGANAGRYYVNLTRTITGIEESTISDIQIFQQKAGVLTVLSSNNDPLEKVAVYATSGICVYETTSIGEDLLQVELPKGMYVVRAKNQQVNKVTKVMIK